MRSTLSIAVFTRIPAPTTERKLKLKLLKEIRAERDLSVEDLSDLSHLSKSTIYNVERGDHCPSESTLWVLAEALDIKVTDIYSPKGSTNLGKPAQSCGRTNPNSQKRYGEHCTQCNETKSLSGTCVCTD
ncbi:helix-turn-helix transcriptional regulator [Candidatus Saccharibacteria bacterium]|nr:helix-turn-helix transcriptional regulator [Candidatus Saccharibacteria bacterium]